jgi:hypothetical protein
MTIFELAAVFGRVLLVATLVVAGLGKLRGRAALAAFADTVADLGWRSPARRAAAVALPLAELGSATLLAIPATQAWGYAAALGLLLVMTTVAAAAVSRGRRLRCRCFGRSEENIGVSTLVRNAVLVLAGAGGLAGTLASAGRTGPPAVAVLGVGGGLLAAALIVYWPSLVYLLRARPARDARRRTAS